MKLTTNKKVNIFLKLCMVGAMWFVAYASVFSSIYVLENGYGSYKYFFYGYHPLVFGIVYFIASLYVLRNIFTRISLEEDCMRLYRFNKTIVLLKYKEIVEIGTGKSYGVRGKKKKIYFSPVKLSEAEKNNLDLVQDRVIYFSHISEPALSFITQKTKVKTEDVFL